MFLILGSVVGIGLLALSVLFVVIAMMFRTVVATNDVHIVQSSKKTVSYGKGQDAGNVYYSWPSWMPYIGVKTIQLPVSVFDVKLDGYAAYDKGRVPFVIDIMAFFRIADSNQAAQRVHSFAELQQQLQGILQGACRTILASSEIETILEGRSEFGEKFTKEVDSNLAQWGVQTVKMIELMDIRDASGSKVIENIMAKKKSLIEKESRIAVAENQRAAQEAEIAAHQAVMIREQEAAQLVGIRTAEKEQTVGISNEQAQQAIKEQAKITAEKDMAVTQVQQVRTAEIARSVQVVQADQQRQTEILRAEGEKQKQVLIAEGHLAAAKLNAEGIQAEGVAKGVAEQAILMAPVNSQIALAQEIGGNEGYQKYLVEIRVVEKDQAVGIAQAKALEDADIKVIANAGDASSGVKSAMDVLSSRGGTQIGAMVEAFAQTDAGAAILQRVLTPPVASKK